MSRSQSAEAARMIKKNLKSAGILCNAKSKNYSMGCNVTVQLLQDYNEEVIQLVRQYISNFEEGNFDGSTDCYNYSNLRNDLPQAKYVFLRDHTGHTI